VDPPECLEARANPDQLSQVLANLLQNDSRYTPSGGRVNIAAEARRDDVLVSVTNTGDGIPTSELPHVFGRSYRVGEIARSGSRGSRHGTRDCQAAVDATGGQVGAESRAGLTRFWFSLPA